MITSTSKFETFYPKLWRDIPAKKPKKAHRMVHTSLFHTQVHRLRSIDLSICDSMSVGKLLRTMEFSFASNRPIGLLRLNFLLDKISVSAAPIQYNKDDEVVSLARFFIIFTRRDTLPPIMYRFMINNFLSLIFTSRTSQSNDHP
jgi:hypothetical protein